MLKIRLQRIGRRHDPKFRVMVIDGRYGPKSNNFTELVGSYDAKLGVIQLNGERIKYWLSEGAQASDTVHNMLISQKIIEGKKVNALPKKTPIIKEVVEEEVKAPVAAMTPAANTTKAQAAEESKEETPITEEPAVVTDTPAEEVKEESSVVEEPVAADAPIEELKEETPTE